MNIECLSLLNFCFPTDSQTPSKFALAPERCSACFVSEKSGNSLGQFWEWIWGWCESSFSEAEKTFKQNLWFCSGLGSTVGKAWK